MAREEALKHASEQEGAATLESQLIEPERDLDPAPEAQRPGHRQACDHGLAGDRTQAFDMATQAGVGQAGMQAEQFAQRRIVSAFNAWAEREGRAARAFIFQPQRAAA